MFDLSDKEIIETIAPFSEELLQKVFADTEGKLAAVVDYSQSKYKGKTFITYLANMAVVSDIRFKGVSKEDRFELVKEYMESRLLVGCPSLAITVASILTAFKGVDTFFANVENPVLNAEEIIEFIDVHNLLVNKWILFMDSTILFCLSTNLKYLEAFGHPAKHNRCHDDARFIGNNVVQLFDIPGFMEIYFSEPIGEVAFFTKQFDNEEYMFAQQNFFSFYMSDRNPIPTLIEMMGSEQYELSDLIKGAEVLERLIEQA